jgi:hypothetical protein
LSDATIEPLSEFDVIPLITKGVAFEQRKPSLRIFLSRNQLNQLPRALFNLEHLTLLSVSGNRLDEIPPGVGRLHNLEELNVGSNRLRWLPFELLELIQESKKLRGLRLHPNQYYQADLDISTNGLTLPNPSPAEEGKADLAFRTRRICRSSVEFFDSNSRIYGDFRLSHDDQRIKAMEYGQDVGLALPSAGHASSKLHANSALGTPSKVPSLVELVLRSLYRLSDLAAAAQGLPDDLPSPVRQSIDKVVALQKSGGRRCSVCKRMFVVPRTMWLEWWRVVRRDSTMENDVADASADDVIPFARVGCSWICMPRASTGVGG